MGRIGDLPYRDHVHRWPRDGDDWNALSRCDTCGLILLDQFIHGSRWVVRRVERITFLDERTVRRRVSVDYLSPTPAVTLEVEGKPPVKVLPLAIMRRKSLVNFDFLGHDGRPMSLLGLREHQALSGAIARTWAALALGCRVSADSLPEPVERIVRQVVAGDQLELEDAYRVLDRTDEPERHDEGDTADPLDQLRRDAPFRVVMDRMADSFILYALDPAATAARQVVKFRYDEPLTLRYREAGYKRTTPVRPPVSRRQGSESQEAGTPTYDHGRFLRWFKPAPLLARLGLTPTLIRFPIPAAELATSFHFEVTAPPEVSIVSAALLAGRPTAGQRPSWSTDDDVPSGDHRPDADWRPSFDSLIGGYPTVDLHVADVPYGSLSRGQVALQANHKGWLTAAVVACWLATATLGVGWLAQKPNGGDTGASLLVTFAAALVALLVRPDPHRMVTRLLSTLRLLATFSAVLTFAAALTFAFVRTPHERHVILGVLALASLVPALLTLAAWLTAIRQLTEKPQRSPWEQRRPRPDRQQDADSGVRYHTSILEACRTAERPYDEAVRRLGFDQPAIKVASSEGARRTFELDRAVLTRLEQRLEAQTHREAIAVSGDVGAVDER